MGLSLMIKGSILINIGDYLIIMGDHGYRVYESIVSIQYIYILIIIDIDNCQYL